MKEQPAASTQNSQSPAAAAADTAAVQLQAAEHLAEEEPQKLFIQCKLTVGAADDPLEEEADMVAEKVMRMPETSFIQQQYAYNGEEKLQRKPLSSFIQRKENLPAAGTDTALGDRVSASKENGQPMGASAKSFMESRFGADFSGVRIHTGTAAAQLSADLNAQAFTTGNDIYFNEGKYSPETAGGRHLLAHELTHVIQQDTNGLSIQRKPGDIGKPEPVETSPDVRENISILLSVYSTLPTAMGGLEQVFVINGTTGSLYNIKLLDKGFEQKLVKTYRLKPLAIPPYYLLALPDNKFAVLGNQEVEMGDGTSRIVDALIGVDPKTEEEKKEVKKANEELTTNNWFLNEKDRDDFNAKITKAGFAVIVLPAGKGASGGSEGGAAKPPMPAWMGPYQTEMRKLIATAKNDEKQSTDLPDKFYLYYSGKLERWRAAASQATEDPKKPLTVYFDIAEKDDKKAKLTEIREKIRWQQLQDVTQHQESNKPDNPQLLWAFILKKELDKLIAEEKKTRPDAADLPDRTGIVTNEDDPNTPHLKLWAYVTANNAEGNAVSTLKTGVMASPLVKGMKAEELLESVKKATLALTANITKPVNENPKDYEHVLAAFPATIESLNIRDDYRSVTGAELEMYMRLNMSVLPGMDLLNQTLTRYNGILFTWDVYRISEVIPAGELSKMPEKWPERRKELQAWFKSSNQLTGANPALKENFKAEVEKLKQLARLTGANDTLPDPDMAGKVMTPDQLRTSRNAGLTYGAATSYDDKSVLGMPMQEGEYVIYCRALAEPGDNVFRLPSEAFFTVKLIDGYKLAEEIRDERLTDIANTEKKIRDEKDEKKKKQLQGELDELKQAEKRTLQDSTQYSIGTQEETIALAGKLVRFYKQAGTASVPDLIVAASKKGEVTDAEFDKLLNLWMMMETGDLTQTPVEKLNKIIDTARKNITGMKEVQGRIREFRDDLKGYIIQPAPVVGLVSRVTGQVYPLMLTIGIKQTGDGYKAMLVDVTTEQTEEKYESSTYSTMQGAVADAFEDFGHKCHYGEGYIAYRIPGTDIAGRAESAPGTWEKIKHVLSIVAAVAGIAALIVGTVATGGALGVAAAYVGVGAMVIGAGLAIDNIYDRAVNHRLHADVELAMDILNIAGPVLQGVGAWAKLAKVATLKTVISAAEEAGEAATVEKGVLSAAQLTRLGNLIKLEKTLMIIQKGEAMTNLGLIGYKTYKDLAMVAEIYADDPKKMAAMQAEIMKNALIAGTFAVIALKNEFQIKNQNEIEGLVNSLAKEQNYEAAMIKSGLKDPEGNWRDPKLKEFFLGKEKEESGSTRETKDQPPAQPATSTQKEEGKKLQEGDTASTGTPKEETGTGAAKPQMTTAGGETFPEVLEPGQTHTFSDGAVARRLPDGTLEIVSTLGAPVGRKGYEDRMLPVGEMGLHGWVRAHSQGQGTGHENPYGILYAPAEVNEAYQNKGIEDFLRTLVSAVPEEYEITLTTYTTAHPGSNRLKSIAYKVDITNTTTGERVPAFEAEIHVSNATDHPKVTTEATPFRIDQFLDLDPEMTSETPAPNTKNLGLVNPEAHKTLRRLNETIERLKLIAKRGGDEGKAAKAFIDTLKARQKELLYKPEDYLDLTTEDLDSIQQVFPADVLNTATAADYLKTLPAAGKKISEAQLKELILKAGNWKELVKMLQAQKRTDLVTKIKAFRQKLVDAIMKKYDSGLLGKPSENPESDIDVNMKGLDAGSNLIKAEQEMQGLLGDGWSEALRLNFYTGSERLSAYKQVESMVGEQAAASFEKQVAQTTADYTLAKMLHHAKDTGMEADVSTMIRKLLPEREENIRSLADNYDAQGVTRRNELLKEVDGLMKQYNEMEAKDTGRISLAQQITLKQMEANFYTTEAYIGPGALEAMGSGRALSTPEKLEAVFSNLEMMSHIVKEAGGEKLPAAREYELYKYMYRTSDAMHMDQMDLFYDYLTKQIYKVNREGMQAARPGEVMGIYNDFMQYVMKYLEANIAAIK